MRIWTIGHSTRSLVEFLGLLTARSIQMLADVRSLPGSKRFPHFNRENLENALHERGIGYLHIEKLGGMRRTNPASVNTAWKHKSFRGYADYMETGDFIEGIAILTNAAAMKAAAFMCSEALWWRCHRSLISDYLKFQGWDVMHILNMNTEEEHPYTEPARIIQGKLTYRGASNP